ncbi:hypothetical protein [Paraburkholderia mimosarum]|uniref:hypothetical protein n=1 Tax=Paraburkholderia mimosarum TaxID=312026 RepID=UPI001FC804A6|nr:hypothetical protein [Paraburkholderia mimosarum]
MVMDQSNEHQGISFSGSGKEKRMYASDTSLRAMVEKWLAPAAAVPVRVTRVASTHLRRMRCVKVEAQRAEGAVAILFFLHRDGAWRVFPPEAKYPAMQAW